MKKCPLEKRGLKSLAEEAAVAAAAEKKDNPDPVTAKAVSTAKAVVMFTSTSIVAAAAAAQDKDQPDDIASGPSCITIAIAVAVTSAVCCCQIAHTNSSNNYLQSIICRAACHSFRFFGKFLERFKQEAGTGAGGFRKTAWGQIVTECQKKGDNLKKNLIPFFPKCVILI